MRFKSVVGAFIFIVLASFIALFVFIQTKSFGNLITKVVTDLSERKLQTKVKIKKFSLSVFPPGIELNQVTVKKKISDVEEFEAELGKIGFYISLIEVEEKKLTFGELRISDSAIRYVGPKKDEELKEIDQALIKKIFDLSDKAPIVVNTLLIENTRIFANHDLLEARRLKIFKKDKSFIARFHLANIKPSAESDFTLDEVWGDGEISRSDIKIYRMKIQHDVQTLLLKGKVTDYYKLANSEAILNGEAQLHLESFNHDFPLPELIQIKGGLARLGFNLNYTKKELTATADINMQNVKSNLFYADELQSELSLNDNKLVIKTLSLSYKEQKAKLSQPVEVFELKNKTYLTKPIHATVQNLTLKNALRIVPSLKPLKGKLTGDLTFQYKNKDLYFTPKDNFVVRDLALVVGGKEKPFTIIKVSKAILKHSQFAVINEEFHMTSSVELAHSKLEVDGFVSKNKVQFNVPNAKVNLEDFGNISQLDVKGAGELSIKVSGPLSATVINLKGRTKGFEILGYKLGETEKDISIELGDSEVVINKMESKFGQTNLSGNGSVNYGDSEIALGISSNDANSHDLTQILHPIFKDLKFLPEDLDFKAKVDVDIFGKYKLDHLKIRSKVHFTDLTAYGENFNTGSFDISLLNQVLAFKELEVSKGRGSINGDFVLGLKDKAMNLNYQWENLELATFNISKRLGMNLNSQISGNIAGSGTLDNYLLKLNTTAFNTKTQNYKFEDSTVALNIMPDRISGKAKVLGKIITSDFNLGLKHGVASNIKLKVEATNLKPLFVALFGQHFENEDFNGRILFEGETSFQNEFKNLNLTASFKELIFSHPEFSINYSSTKPEFIVKNSHIQKWDLNIRESDLFIVTKGEGDFGRNVSLTHEINFNSKILDLLVAPILSAEGFLKNTIKVYGKGTNFDFAVTSKTDDLDLSIEQLPIPINNLKYDIEYLNTRLNIRELTTHLDAGSVALKGDVFFDSNQPDVNLKFIFDEAEIPILGKSSVNLTGEGIILGNDFPYNVSGELVLNRGQIVNELNEFSSKSAAFSQIRFLPKNQESAIGKLFVLNINFKIENSVRITNSLMDVALKGEVRILGNPSRPRGEGRVSTPPGSSRIFFKNNEYIIKSADITFNPKKPISNPDFDVQAMTIISNYKVYPKAYGDLERFNFDLTSDPVLPRSSVLSLIALGYTNEIQVGLRPEDQQSLNKAGIGSFVFDRFKINDILNRQFGLQINLGTVIEQSATDSLLTGRQGGGTLGQNRSATKIELKKRLNEATTLSVSSTMGGGLGQRQSMNLNYGINRNVQLEGVYEQRSNQFDQDVNYNSVGGDIKFRGTFK
jgi:translocation and assembly module TamB